MAEENRRAQTRREEVFEVCEEIVEEGLTPTTRMIIDRIAGSSTTATKYLREWKASNLMAHPDAKRMVEDAYNRLAVDVQSRVEAAETRAEEAERRAAQAIEEAEQAKKQTEDAKQDREQGKIDKQEAEQIRVRAIQAINEAKNQAAIARNQQEAAAKAEQRAQAAETQARETMGRLDKASERLTTAAEQMDRARKAIEQRLGRVVEGVENVLERQRSVDEGQADLAERILAQTSKLSEFDRSMKEQGTTHQRKLDAQSESAQQAVKAAVEHLDRAINEARQVFGGQIGQWFAQADERLEALEEIQSNRTKAVSDPITALTRAVDTLTSRLDQRKTGHRPDSSNRE
jgi:DNA repair exonuclease SbcCD ATPase subunit